MKNKKILLSALLLSLTLAGCDNASTENQGPKTALTEKHISNKAQALKNLADIEKNTFNFSTGKKPSTAGESIYVFFDPQCPHCNKLWQNAHDEKAKDISIIWIPVAFLNKNSLPQASTILSAEDPVAKMAEHEDSMSSGGLGLDTVLVTSPKFVELVNKNNAIFDSLQGRGVPLLLKVSQSGEIIAASGELSPDLLKEYAQK